MGDDIDVQEKTSTNKPDKDGNQDVLIMQQQRKIEQEICDSIAIIGELEPVLSLEMEYRPDDVYAKKVRDLSSKYKSIRRTRPDGNCFFRAFAYAYFERLLEDKQEYQRFYDIASKSKETLVNLGFPKFTVEDFHDTFMEVIDNIGKEESTKDDLHKLFNTQGHSDYVVVFLRLITSGQLQKDADFYQHFIEGERSVSDFCHQEVEPMFKESDHIHIIALSTALSVGVRVRYMDRGGETEVIAHDFPEGSTPSVHLLYRPGHYDILYP
ncbi:hypothetical protein RUM43_009985 [Polyplax serrata]|uniref:Ubiquitin thioesterase n=1 Tax=Polyplax serrata TaxID=468196 RepID=A0AAN8S6Z9_POLSC